MFQCSTCISRNPFAGGGLLRLGPKVSEKEACSLLRAMWTEVRGLHGAQSLPSASLLAEGSNLARTGHENRLTSVLERMDLSATVPISYVDVGLKDRHPILSLRSFVETLSEKGKLEVLFCGHSERDYLQFWKRFKQLQPGHPIYELSDAELGLTIPLYIHGDEGTSQKKRGIMILQTQVILGHGSSRATDLNYNKNSILTRMLFSVMATRVYSGKGKKNQPLLALVEKMAIDLASCYHNPVPVTLHGRQFQVRLLPLGLKGDLQALVKISSLTRHFMRDTWMSPTGPGICHLCTAGRNGSPWHQIDFRTMLTMRVDADMPWKVEPAFLQHLPHSPDHKPDFCLLDVFHTVHKGVLGDACASTIATCKLVVKFSTHAFPVINICT